MRVLRILAAVAIVVAAMVAIQRWCVAPLHCERLKKYLEATSLRLVSVPDEYARAPRARRNLELIQACLGTNANDLDFLLLKALNLRLMGRAPEAVIVYQHAIAIEERPEIDFMVGETLLELNRRAEATQAFTRAVLFNPYLMYDIGDQEMITSIRAIRIAYEENARKGHQLRP